MIAWGPVRLATASCSSAVRVRRAIRRSRSRIRSPRRPCPRCRHRVPPNNSFRHSSSMSPKPARRSVHSSSASPAKPTPSIVRAAGITLLSWGGETATRFNHLIGASNGGERLRLPESTDRLGRRCRDRPPRRGIRRRRRQPGRRPDARVGRQERRAHDLFVPARQWWVLERQRRELSEPDRGRRPRGHQRRLYHDVVSRRGSPDSSPIRRPHRGLSPSTTNRSCGAPPTTTSIRRARPMRRSSSSTSSTPSPFGASRRTPS